MKDLKKIWNHTAPTARGMQWESLPGPMRDQIIVFAHRVEHTMRTQLLNEALKLRKSRRLTPDED